MKGMKQVWVYEETHKEIKRLAAQARMTIMELLKANFPNATAEERGYKADEAHDQAVLDAKPNETGKGVSKAKSRFRRLFDTPRDFETWEHYKETGEWEAYVTWFEETFGMAWKGDAEFGSYLRG